MCFEMSPLTGRVAHAEDELARLSGLARSLESGPIVLVHEPVEAASVQLCLGSSEHRDDRLTHVAAAAAPEDEHEVGRGRDQAAEQRGLAARGRDQCPREKERDGEAADSERDLEPDRARDVAVGLLRDRPGRVQGDVRRERCEHANALDWIGRRDPLVRRQRDTRHRPLGQKCATRLGEVRHEPLLLHELCASLRIGDSGECRLVVVARDRRSRSAVEQRSRGRREQRRGPARIGLLPVPYQLDLGHVALGQRPLAGGDLEQRCTMPGMSRRPDGEGGAQSRHEREREQDRDDRPPRARRKGTELGRRAAHQRTTRVLCMPPM